MSKRNSEDWERTRHYLIKSFFEDISVPSSVPEEPVSKTSSPSNYDRLDTCSSLPELIIEVVQKPNPHDEPEEYYVGLERRMRKYYKKLMKMKQENFETCSSTSMEMERVNKRSTRSTDFDNTKISSTFSLNESESVENNEMEVKVEINTEFNNSIDVRSAKISSAVVKKEKVGCPSSNHENAVNSSCMSTTESFSTDTSVEGNGESTSEKSGSSTSSINEPEAMRRQDYISSHGSFENDGYIDDKLHQSYAEDDFIKSISNSTKQLMGTSAGVSNVRDLSYDDFEFKSYIGRCSTPKISNHSSQSEGNLSGSNENKSEGNGTYTKENKIEKNRNHTKENTTEASEQLAISSKTFESDIIHDSSKVSSATNGSDQSETITTCTSIGDDLPELHGETSNVNEVNKIDRGVQTSAVDSWDILKHNFFVGTPKIYNLCACKKH